ncbi:unnamed protein product [Nesidiocoris tenuis]|uniref:guanylate cyclase n=1 Tax=Nesidiocoris tenuis TaxID=355587 RepID=A0A6H5GQP8_9HEMI|nr:unnamed protein product [Nesidiocoris tenuis]CAB0006156.1 unnamed protein product [Nesidiocoris tenuis]
MFEVELLVPTSEDDSNEHQWPTRNILLKGQMMYLENIETVIYLCCPSFESVSVLFVELVSLKSAIASVADVMTVVSSINAAFSAFDAILDRYKVYKQRWNRFDCCTYLLCPFWRRRISVFSVVSPALVPSTSSVSSEDSSSATTGSVSPISLHGQASAVYLSIQGRYRLTRL